MSDSNSKVKEFGKHIIHLEDLKPNEFLAFLKAWKLENEKIVITEKMDGFFLSFGLENNSFYLQTKHSKWTSPEQIADVYFLQSMKRYFMLLQNAPIAQILTPYGYKPGDLVKFSGEAIPSYDHNIVMYDEKHIGNGAFIIFQVSINEQKITDPKMISDIATKMQSTTEIKFKGIPRVGHLQNVKIPNKVVVDIENFIKKHGNVLAAPARTEEAKLIKQKIVELIKGIGTKIKSKFLAVPYEPAFGGDYEGYVLKMPDGNLIKIVDKDKFTTTKEANWVYINQYSNALDSTIRKLKNKEISLKDAVSSFESELNRIDGEFVQNKDKFTIGKKVRDTEENGKRMRKILAKLKELLAKGVEAEQVVDMAKNKQLDEGLLVEGGGAIKQANSLVPQKYLQTTVKHALELMGLSDVEYDLVGNISKEFLGDVDVALSPESLVKSYNLDPKNFWEDLKNYLASHTKLPFQVNKGFRQFHIGVPIVNEQGKQIKAIDPTTKQQTEEPAIAQIDFMIGNRDWMRNVLSGAKDSKYKAALRNALLAAMSRYIPSPPNTGYMFTLRDGLQFITFDDLSAPKPKELSRELVASNSQELLNKLFKNITWEEVNNFEKLWQAFLSEKNKYPQNKKEVYEDFKKRVLNIKMEIPDEAQSLTEETMSPQGKTIGLYAGSFKPFHEGHLNVLKYALTKSDEVILYFALSDRGELSKETALNYFKKYIVPIIKKLGKPVKIQITDNPVRSVFETLGQANDDESNTNTYILFADEQDFRKRYSDKDLNRYMPKLMQQGRIKQGVTPRGVEGQEVASEGGYKPSSASGTKVRAALAANDLEALQKLLPPELMPKAQEIMKLLNKKNINNKGTPAMNKKQLSEIKMAMYEMNGSLQEKAPPGYESQVEQLKKMLMLKGFDEERAANIAFGKAWNAYEQKKPLMEKGLPPWLQNKGKKEEGKDKPEASDKDKPKDGKKEAPKASGPTKATQPSGGKKTFAENKQKASLKENVYSSHFNGGSIAVVFYSTEQGMPQRIEEDELGYNYFPDGESQNPQVNKAISIAENSPYYFKEPAEAFQFAKKVLDALKNPEGIGAACFKLIEGEPVTVKLDGGKLTAEPGSSMDSLKHELKLRR